MLARLESFYKHSIVSLYCETNCRYKYGLFGKVVDTACFHSFLYNFQTSLIYYNSVTPEWIKYKADTVLCHIYTQLLLLWQRRVEVTGAHQNFFDLKYQILFIYLNIMISERENVVKLNIDIRWTSNVTCGKFERCRDSNINVMIFCCEIHWMKSLKSSWCQGLGGAACYHKSFHRGRENSSMDQ